MPKFNYTRAQKFIGDAMIDNNPEAFAKAMGDVLRDQEFPVNEEQLLVWCEYDYNRRHRKFSANNSYVPPPVKAGTIITRLRTYFKYWYHKHIQWMRSERR
jgi:hypothetical protein